MSRHASTTSFAAKLKLAQAAKGLTNEELARTAGVQLRLLQRYRSGEVEPSGATLARLCVALDRSAEWFYDEDVVLAADDETAAA